MSVSFPRGFLASGISAGIKESGNLDLALIVNEGPQYTAAAVFTTNRVVGEPVKWSRKVIEDGQARAIILNSGGANVCTGTTGYADAQNMATKVASHLDVPATDVLVASTGLIGVHLPMAYVLAGVDTAIEKLSKTGGANAALAIMTTDTVPKNVEVQGSDYRIGGMAKGAGMLAPALATMLSVLTTDAELTAAEADEALRVATAQSFDRIDSDGSMSTSDTVVLMASGVAGPPADKGQFISDLTDAATQLARALIADAEGASHDIEIRVHQAHSESAAIEVARAVSRSNLVKTAIFGNDPNWGRVLAQIGTVPQSVAAYDPDELDVTINGVMVCRGGQAYEDRSLVNLAEQREVTIDIDLHAGDAQATIWTNDLTHEYVTENSAYST